MTTESMTEVQRSGQSQSGHSLSVQNISSILLSDGKWHNVNNPQKTEFSISSSPATDGPYTYLTYQEGGDTVYVPFRQICGFKFNSLSSQSR